MDLKNIVNHTSIEFVYVFVYLSFNFLIENLGLIFATWTCHVTTQNPGQDFQLLLAIPKPYTESHKAPSMQTNLFKQKRSHKQTMLHPCKNY